MNTHRKLDPLGAARRISVAFRRVGRFDAAGHPKGFGRTCYLEHQCNIFHLPYFPCTTRLSTRFVCQHVLSTRFVLTLQRYRANVRRLLTPARTFAVVVAKC